MDQRIKSHDQDVAEDLWDGPVAVGLFRPPREKQERRSTRSPAHCTIYYLGDKGR